MSSIFTHPFLIQNLSHISNLGILIYFSSIGYIIPIPEEITLTILGYLAGIGKFNPWLVFAYSLAGVMIGDNVFYWLCYRHGKYLLQFKNKVNAEMWQKYENLMTNNIGKTLVILRFLVGFRFLGPVIAGSLRVKWRRFITYDLPIVACYLGAFIYLGVYFRRRYLLAISLVEQLRSFLLAIILILLVIFIVRKFLWKNNGK